MKIWKNLLKKLGIIKTLKFANPTGRPAKKLPNGWQLVAKTAPTLAAAAAELELSERQLQRRMRAAGITRKPGRPKVAPPAELLRKALMLKNQVGLSNRSIAKELGVSHVTISKWLRDQATK